MSVEAIDLALQVAIIEGLLDEKLPLVLKEYEETIQGLRERIDEIRLPGFVLPEDVAFDSNVQDALLEARQEISLAEKRINASFDRFKTAHEKLRAEYSEHAHDAYSKLDHLHEDLAKASSVEASIESTKTSLEAKIQAGMDALTAKSDAQIKGLKTSLDKVQKLVSEHINLLDSKISAESETLSGTIQVGLKNAASELKKVLVNLESYKQEISTSLIEIRESKSDVDHEHDDDYSKIGHTHDDKADANHTHKEFKTLARKDHNHDDAYSKLEHEHSQYALEKAVDASISSIKKEMKKKIDAGTFDAFKDQFPSKGELIKEIKASLPTPKDGKDGFNWEFKFHPTKRGILLYRREDEAKWRSYDLTVKAVEINPQPQGPIGGGGFIIGTPTNYLIVSDSTTSVSEVSQIEFVGAVVTNPQPNKAVVTISASGSGSDVTGYVPGGSVSSFKVWMGKTLTDSNGEFIFDISSAGFTTVLSYNVCAHIDNHVNLSIEERLVSCNVVDVTSTLISGVSFVQRELVLLLGKSTFALVRAPQDIIISITVYGI